jgi:[ribosomal protein S5]-alanine N-acetyltransferase
VINAGPNERRYPRSRSGASLRPMLSERLRYAPLEAAHLEAFHGLVEDDHVRRYLLDGQKFPREWTSARIADSRALFQRRGVGLWLAHERSSGELVGFCGFLEFADQHPEPQLIYALLERFVGRGYATEMARAAIAEARLHPGFVQIIAGVDEVNARSLRLLEKLGFQRFATLQGSFGNLFLLQLVGTTP